MGRTLVLLCFSVLFSVETVDVGRNGQCVDVDEYFRVPEDEGDDGEPPIASDLPLSAKSAICPQESNGNCQAGWKSFSRPSGEWCVKPFYENYVSQPSAESRCQAEGATLSGFQNQIELQYVLSTVTTAIAPQTGSVWFGLKRRPECSSVGRTANCTAMNSFEWTDKSASGTDGLIWNTNQPDNSWQRTQQCAVLTVGSTGYVLGYQSGTMDDVNCTYDFVKANPRPRDVRAFVCGKKP